VITNKQKQETYSIPLNRFRSIKLKPTFVRTAGRVYTYELSFLTERETEESISFKTYPGKRLKQFMEILKQANPQMEEKHFTFY
jgi:hypothetical protein